MEFFTVCFALLSISIIKVVNQAVKESVCNKYNDAGHPQRQKAQDFNVSQVAVAAAINCQSPRFIGGLITTIMKGLWATESAVISANGNEGILNKLWDKANNAKSSIEERERESLQAVVDKAAVVDKTAL
ncbi:oxysterol-binding protein [Artemisia annua]|uniref:Oxysterol-binding protein n=1 Tax=Artemisia annua TaxID=35608 RepID=A0A2U1N647_ARTAN|nr:oxysterol-binding protein [Artemisia annua]